jgi:hypothetical protein
MSNYTQSTNFATKDALSSGDPLKIVKGTEINTEFVNISVAIATKADLASPTFSGTPSLPTGTTGVTQSSSDDTTKLATTAFVQDVADVIKSALFPVGTIYTATVSTNPSTLLGFGTWSAYAAGRVLVGVGGAYTAGLTGGSADATVVSHSHTGSSSTVGDHTHGINGGTGVQGQVGAGFGYGASNDNTSVRITSTDSGGSHSHSITVDAAGSSGTNANMQPYIVVYMWQRTA